MERIIYHKKTKKGNHKLYAYIVHKGKEYIDHEYKCETEESLFDYFFLNNPEYKNATIIEKT